MLIPHPGPSRVPLPFRLQPPFLLRLAQALPGPDPVLMLRPSLRAFHRHARRPMHHLYRAGRLVHLLSPGARPEHETLVQVPLPQTQPPHSTLHALPWGFRCLHSLTARVQMDKLQPRSAVNQSYPPLFYAASSGDLEAVREHAPDASLHDLNQALAQAAALSQFETADALIDAGAEPNGVYDPLYGTVLFPACEYLNPDGIAYLLERDADPAQEVIRIDGVRNALDHLLQTHHRSPLKTRCIQLLLRAGAPDPGDAPMAVHLGSLSRLEHALKNDDAVLQAPLELDYGHHPLRGATLLHMAVEYNQPELAAALLDRGLDVNQRAERIPGSADTSPVWPTDLVALGGQTPLFHAKDHSRDMLKFLLERGADPSIPAWFLRDGKELQLTPLEFFEEIDRIECNLLEEILTLRSA